MSDDAVLDEVATKRLVGDLVGAEPCCELLQLVGDTARPELITELVRGLIEDGNVRIEAGRAEPVGGSEVPVPQRVRVWVQDELASVSRLARHTAVVTSTVGARARLDHVASMLATSAGALLGPVEELMRVGVLVDAGARLRFSSPLLRQAVFETVAPAVRQALQREAIETLARSGDSPIEPATGLASTAEPGDPASISALMTASRALEMRDASAAAQLCLSAYRLSRPGDGRRTELAAEAASRLHAAGRAQAARALVDEALRDRPWPEAEARIRLSVAQMTDLAPEVRSRMGREALALSGLSATLRARHLAAQVANVASEGRPDLARDLLAEADAAVVASRDVAAVIALDAAKAQLTYMEGSFGTTLGLLGHLEARMSAANDADEHARLVGLLLGDVLVAVDEFDAAERLIADGFSSAARERRLATSSAWQRLHGRWALQLGRVADAAAILDPVFNVEADDAVASVSDAATMAALGRIAMHLGDGRKARTFAKVAQAVTVSGAPELRRHATLLLALLASARRDVDAARCHLHALGSEGLDHALPMLMQDPSDHAHLVRLALDVGDIALARSATASAEACAAANPGVVSIAGTAAHARGLLHRDPSALADAVELLAAGHRPMAHASAAEDHGAELSRIGDQQGAIDALGAALRLYTFSGASWDASRVRSRLREHGVRRRIVKPARPTSGWAGLTDAEAAVVRRVVDGLTNREVAEQLYLSPHTVSMHLRHVFTKLHINSRVELARLAFEQEAAA